MIEKPTRNRLLFGFLQHVIAAVVFVGISALLFYSCFSIETLYGKDLFQINPYNAPGSFEDSEVFSALFETSLEDILSLVWLRDELETNGVFDGEKEIDITAFAARTVSLNDCSATASYRLADLIKWGRSGISYTMRTMTMSAFVNYFGSPVMPCNYAVDEDGNLYFTGFNGTPDMPAWESDSREDVTILAESYGMSVTAYVQVAGAMRKLEESQLEEMAFLYLREALSEYISVTAPEDDAITVTTPMLDCAYATTDGELSLIEYAGNWIEFMDLQSNLAYTIETLSTYYEDYLCGIAMYDEEATNVRYMVRMESVYDGQAVTYTNFTDLIPLSDEDVTDYFSSYQRFLIYYPDSLEYMGTASLDEEQLYLLLKEKGYADAESMLLWVGIDTRYGVTNDAFATAASLYNAIVPKAWPISITLLILSLAWAVLFVWLIASAGIGLAKDTGLPVGYVNYFDRLFTEIYVCFFALCLFAGYPALGFLSTLVGEVYTDNTLLLGLSTEQLIRYGAFAGFGFMASMLLSLFVYSFARRLRGHLLIKGSLGYFLSGKIKAAITYILDHPNSAVSTLLPYNCYILCNLLAITAAIVMRDEAVALVFILLGIVLFNGIVGVYLFRNATERLYVVDGITRIRGGEVEYVLEPDTLHGANKDLAHAVNTIGDGIRIAVKTSMKDEQMKTDLITNVSHDIKTPLTSIITYVDLLKHLKIEDERARNYLAILDTKSQRLKQLTDDLVEVSKITSGNIILENAPIDLGELLVQTLGEFGDVLQERGLKIVFSEEEACNGVIFADGRRIWRVLENLFTNIRKYAKENSEVVISLRVANKQVVLSIENEAAHPFLSSGEADLTERFVRGDVSRTSEGSGLGLSIAKHLVEIQGGRFHVAAAGESFCVTMAFPAYDCAR